jgi:hypothetical protein
MAFRFRPVLILVYGLLSKNIQKLNMFVVNFWGFFVRDTQIADINVVGYY